MNQSVRLNLLRATLAVTTVLTLGGFYQFVVRTYQAELVFASRRHTLIAAFLTLAVIMVSCLFVASWTPLKATLLKWLDSGLHFAGRLGKLNLVIFAIVLLAFTYISLARPIQYLDTFYLRLLFYWLVVIIGSALLWASGLRRSFFELFSVTLLLVAVVYKAASYIPEISTLPFTLGWSEASRYYYASLYFSKQIYGISVPPTVLHPSRYLLQSIPFLIPNSPLWLHRLWQVLLWLVITYLSSYLLARRLTITDSLKRWMFIGWSFLYLLLGPVYYHLQVISIIIFLGYDRRKFWKTFAVVILASIWAGISRINWFPVPGLLAAAIFLLEEATEGKPFWRYIFKPALWTIAGTLVAFASQALYVVASGNPTEQFTSSFTSDLLWYRLLPNPTYHLGVLLAILIVSSPLFILIYVSLTGRWRSYHPLRLLGLSAILLVLLAGGLVVSTKIGGGSNLHNLDGYLTILLVVSSWLYFGKSTPDRLTASTTPTSQQAAPLHWVAVLYILLVPIYFTMYTGPSYEPVDPTRVNQALESINNAARSAHEKGGDVLLIAERQLLTFRMLDDVPLVPDYEKVFLMEMAMAENPDYLDRFHNDLKSQRFSLIVSEPLAVRYKGGEKSFGEENDAWVKNVAEPILCYYEPFRTFRELKVQLLKPRSEPVTCPPSSTG